MDKMLIFVGIMAVVFSIAIIHNIYDGLINENKDLKEQLQGAHETELKIAKELLLANAEHGAQSDVINQLEVALNDMELELFQIHADYDDIVSVVKTRDSQIAQGVHNLDVIKEQYEMLCNIVEAEVTGGSYTEKLNVALAVLNRVESDNFPDTLEEVIFQKGQFSPVSDMRYYNAVPNTDTRNACAFAILGLADNMNKGQLYFMNPKYSTVENVKWFNDNLTYLFKDDIGHYYFK